MIFAFIGTALCVIAIVLSLTILRDWHFADYVYMPRMIIYGVCVIICVVATIALYQL
jgi:hypothetical protein